VARTHKERGDSCITVHVGWSTGDDSEIDRLVGATLEASSRADLPIFIETHRATITQDRWCTVQIAKRFPEVRLKAIAMPRPCSTGNSARVFCRGRTRDGFRVTKYHD